MCVASKTAVVLAVLLAVAPARAQESRGAPFKIVTLPVKRRLELPFYRTPVGPEHPLKLAGRKDPVSFTGSGDAMRADATTKDRFDCEVKEGDVVSIRLDGPEVGGRPPRRAIAFRRGKPSAGEPEWSAVVLDALTGKIGPESVMCVDHDADGTFMTPFRDFIVHAGDGQLAPIGPVVVLGRTVYAASFDESKATALAKEDKTFATPDVFPTWQEAAKGLAHINEIRGAMNLPPFALNRVASRAAFLHARYCGVNHVFQHEEEPGKPGFTSEGAKAGRDSIGSGGGSVVGAIDGFLSTLFHRTPLVDPRLCEIGIGADGGQVWIEYVSGVKRPWLKQGPVIFPGPAHSWNAGAFADEQPDPRPAGASGVGLPITCAWYGEEPVTHATAVLRLESEEVACFRWDAERKELAQPEMMSIMEIEVKATLLPKRSLRYKPHRLTLSWTEDGKRFELEHPFHIGKR